MDLFVCDCQVEKLAHFPSLLELYSSTLASNAAISS